MDGRKVGAVAWSVDGTTFTYRSPVGGELRLGGYAVVEAPHGELLGQVLSQQSVENAGRRPA